MLKLQKQEKIPVFYLFQNQNIRHEQHSFLTPYNITLSPSFLSYHKL